MDSATQMLKRAVGLDGLKKYSEAKICYEEGIEMLLKSIPTLTDQAMKTAVKKKIEGYMERAEELKTFIKTLKKDGKFHEKIEIGNNQRGYSYSTIFSKFIDDKLTEVVIKDAYIRSHHQILNLLRFSELLVRKARNLKNIVLVTGKSSYSLEVRKILSLLIHCISQALLCSAFSYGFGKFDHFSH